MPLLFVWSIQGLLKKDASSVLGLRAHRLGALRTVRVRRPQRTPVYASASSLPAAFAGPGSAEAASRRRAPFLNSPCSFCRLRVGVREACYREFFELFNRPIQPEFRSRRCDLLLVVRISLFASAQRRNDEAPSTRVQLPFLRLKQGGKRT